MASYTGTVLTDQGADLLDKIQLGGLALEFSRAAIGDGTLPGGGNTAELVAMTALVNERMSLAIQSIEIIGTGRTRVNVYLTNEGLVADIAAREIGLFATDPDLGEILYAVAYAHDHPDYIPADGSETAVAQTISIDTIIGNATDVTAVWATTAATNVEIQRHFVPAVSANGADTFVLPWTYAPRTPNLAIYADGTKQVRGIDWDPPSGEESADASSTVEFAAALSGLTKGLEFFSIPVASGVFDRQTVWHKTADFTCRNDNNNHVLTNLGATGEVVFTLSGDISIGTKITFVKEADFDLTLQAAAGETIVDSSAAGTMANTAAAQIGATLTVQKTTEDHWTILTGFGLWETT